MFKIPSLVTNFIYTIMSDMSNNSVVLCDTTNDEKKQSPAVVKKQATVCLTSWYYKTPYTVLRRSKILFLDSLLSSYDSYMTRSSDKRLELLRDIEVCCYNSTIDKAHKYSIIASWEFDEFCNLYHAACYKLSSNIEKNGIVSNHTFAEKLLASESIGDLINYTSQEMFPEMYSLILKRMELSKNILQTVKTSMLYRCERCGENKCTMENIIVRSLDEGISVKLDCMNCGNSWMDTSK